MKTLAEPSADLKQRDAYGRRVKETERTVITPGVKYAMVLLELHPSAVPSDYAALRTVIKAIPRIQEVTLLVDNQNAAGDVQTALTIPAGTQLMLYATADVRIE